MTNLKLVQLAVSEFKLDTPSDFCLNSHDNHMTLIGNTNDICVMDLKYSFDSLVLLPYSIKFCLVPQDKPFINLVKHVDFVKLYGAGSVEESQELSLDPVYTAGCSIDPPKARVLQVGIIPTDTLNVCCILTTYGVCALYQKNNSTEEWEPFETNLSKILITDIFPMKISPMDIKSYKDLKNYVNQYLITCFTWSIYSNELIIYLGTAAGYVIALKYMQTSQEFKEYCCLKTSLDRLSYIAIFNNILLVSSDQGQVRLMKINHDANTLEELDYLWSKKDRMSCRKAVINYNENLNSYLVVFCKAAHVLAYRLNLEGSIISSSTLYIRGIKITGLEYYTENSYIITTVMGTVKHIQIVCPTPDELQIEETLIEHEFDSTNLQILGIGATKSRNLWSFLLSRNKEYTHQSKYSANTAFLTVAKMSTDNSLTKLINTNLNTMDVVQDLLISIHLDIFNNNDVQQYMDYLPLEKLHFPTNLNDAFLQKLQIKILISRQMASYQKLKYKKQKPHSIIDLQFLEPSVQLLYILHRLQFLQKLYSSDNKLSAFQELSIVCMQFKFNNLLTELGNISNNDEHILHTTAEHFLILILAEFEKCKFNIENMKYKPEHCFTCNAVISDTTFEKCSQEHDIKRCSISYTQLNMFHTKYCPHCFALARNDDAANLQELFAKDEIVKCIYCRFLLKHDNI